MVELTGCVFVQPGVLLDLSHCEATNRVGIQKFTDQVLGLLGYLCYVILELEVPDHDFLEHFALILTVEWELAVEHSIENHPTTPGIDFGSIVGTVL